MPHIREIPEALRTGEKGTKRKREDESGVSRKAKKQAADNAESAQDIQAEILLLETGIVESRKNYNSIATLLNYLEAENVFDARDVVAAVALYRVFCRLMALGNMTKTGNTAAGEDTIVQWLRERLQDYEKALLRMLLSPDPSKQNTALTLLMRLVKEKSTHLTGFEDTTWRNGLFSSLLQTLASFGNAEAAREEFIEKYVEEYDDVRYHTFARLADDMSKDDAGAILPQVLHMLSAIEPIPEQRTDLDVFFLTPPTKKKHELYALAAHKKQAQKAWMSVLRQDLDKAQRKKILDLMSRRIAPWFLKVEMLMDFLTDSFNVGGSTSLMALSGLFYLIQQKNLDYPQFYLKLYSLLDANILHSKHRARFFRLLDTFLASTHLPAALVASFIKRLSRLCLHAPPSGIVVVVPWIYNLLKNHPTCTFMIHRTMELQIRDEDGWGDPFIMNEPDPMASAAIESSLWEIQTLQSHYHPNVAAIAKIISEQFTKQAYNIEDFLDHSYATMLDAELSKDIKKPPEIEYEISKRIFSKHDAGASRENSLLVQLWDFS